jgi:hypothetical protein
MSKVSIALAGLLAVLLPMAFFVRCDGPDRSGVVHVHPVRDEGRQVAEILTYADGSRWLVVAGNEETKILYRNESFVIVSGPDRIPNYLAASLAQVDGSLFPLLCRIVPSPDGDDTLTDRAWCIETGEVVFSR